MQLKIYIKFTNVFLHSGCRFPGDVICDTAVATLCNYKKCLLADEGKNLWKKPTLTVTATIKCGLDIGLMTEFCNTNSLLLKAVGLIKEKNEGHESHTHQLTVIKQRDPCLLFRDPCVA